ncbi:glycoside hydrolase family 47 protein [Mycena amicta]|nr:glycoside hydrolase family 47 protein [Mycena amicta]
MSDPPTPTLRQRRPANPPAPQPAHVPDSKVTPPKASSSGILAALYLVVVVAGFVALAGGAAAYLYYSNGEYFHPTPRPEWFSSPDKDWRVDFSADVEKREEVVKAFRHAWSAYERDAMGCDEYHPVARKGSNLTSAGGIGYTIVDALDTMMLMGLDAEYARARRWIAESLDFDRDAEVSLFETTIRLLGGLLSAYHLASSPSPEHTFILPTDAGLYLNHAQTLGSRLLPGFSSASGLPFSMVNLHKRVGVPDKDHRGLVSTAEAATLQLEFRYLSWVLGEDDFSEEDGHGVRPEEYWEKAERVMKVIRAARANGGLAPIFMSMDAGKFVTSDIRLGSRGDSYYEYLLKQYLQTASTEPIYREMYSTAMAGVHHSLLVRGPRSGLLFTQEVQPKRDVQKNGGITWVRIRKQDHLVCFLGGSLMLGAVTVHKVVETVSVPPKEHELSEAGRKDWSAGVELIETCVDTYRTKTGLSPEIVHFREAMDKKGKKSKKLEDEEAEKRDWFIKDAKPPNEPPVYDARYILRPETIESLFLAFRLTGNPRYRAYAYTIFEAIERHCKVPTGGYAGVRNVEDVRTGREGEEDRWEDKMETFLLSETLKYLFLIFSDQSVLPLDEYVFNTEAHPLPIFRPGAGMMHMEGYAFDDSDRGGGGGGGFE